MIHPTCTRGFVCVLAVVALSIQSGLAFTDEPRENTDLASFEKGREGGVIGVVTVEPDKLAPEDALRQGWQQFIGDRNGGWKVHLDMRSGLPALVAGRGIAWEATDSSLENLQQTALQFLENHSILLGDWGDQIVLDLEASVRRGDRVRQLSFRQQVSGVPVEGARFDFHLTQGNMVAFGATRWSEVQTSPVPSISRSAARSRLNAYVGIDPDSPYLDLEPGSLLLIPVNPDLSGATLWTGPAGQGYGHRLVWRFAFQDPDTDPIWVGEVDAHTGAIFSFYNDTRYERIKGHVSPVTDNGDCANDGCLVPDYPMPFADYSINGGADLTAGEFGLYECTTLGDTITTNLDGPYIWINDQCGSVSATVTCDGELDLGVSDGINCNVAAGQSAGNTDAARSSFYNIGRVIQKAQYWMPSNNWVRNRLEIRTNVNSTCNATWGGRLNMYRAGNGCGNTGQLQGVVVHEWGHGMDQNDGGGYDNPSEGYADVVAVFENRESCVGRGFRPAQQCSGYGDTCLNCTGIRDMDWDARQDHTPATPSGFETTYCPSGGGPCGSETHCAAYVPGEAMFDLATRDLPAMGLDEATAWQLAERLFYESRPGSGGNAFNCSLPSSDSCGTTSWYHQLRVQDDDDGDLSNGTPHAAAIFAAFDRHDIACGSAGDAENQNSGTCPSLTAPVVTTRSLTNTVELTWDAVAGASSYRIYRNEHGCDRSQVPLAEVTATTYLDEELANDFPAFYRVEPIGANSACTGALSACLEASAQPLAGRVKFNQPTYGCSNEIVLQVTDANHSAGTINIAIWSDSEPAPETVLLTETAPGSGKFFGSIFTTSDPAAADGQLSIADSGVITAEYMDEDDGNGGFNIAVQSGVLADCVFPAISNVNEQNITGSSATVTWNTNELSSSELAWDETTPPGNTSVEAADTTAHMITITGLEECTVYYYEVRSTDPAGNIATDDNGGSWFSFETLGDLGQGLQPCHAGQVVILSPVYSCNDTAVIRVTDLDLNLDSGVAEMVAVNVASTTEPGGEPLVLTETGPNTSVFAGSIVTVSGPPVPDGTVQTGGGDLMTATYLDSDDGTGAPAVSFDTAVLDCSGATITNLNVNSLTNSRATFSWETDEPTDRRIDWGTTPALGEVFSAPLLRSTHNITLSRFHLCETIWFRVTSTDAHGNTTVADDNGQPFRFSTWDIPGLYVLEDFEDGTAGWTLEGEWEIDIPQGGGGSSGNPDPSEAYSNDKLLGHDLTGLGSNPYDYESLVNESAFSPVYDGTTWTNTRLIYHRRLNSGDGDDASIWYTADGTGRPAYLNQGQTTSESSFQNDSADISNFADGAAAVQLEFRQSSNGSGHYSGWNVDDIILKDGSLPDYGECGSCATPPSFAGAVSAVDNDACGSTGVTVSWESAVAWGSGGQGTYALYRDTVPGFTPSAGNLVASGIATLSYIDATAPNDTVLHYLVRSENNEGCGTGPNNSGAMDANDRTVQVSETTTQAIPAALPGLQLDLVGNAHVRLDWNPVPAATGYRVYRSLSPDPLSFGLLGETGSTLYEDIGEGVSENNYYYQVRGVNACDQEGD
jgi:hypothetical protein